MPRRSLGPRLYLDKKRRTWSIRDGERYTRTGCPESARSEAEKALANYISKKHQPPATPEPTVADVLLFYAREHGQHTRRPGNIIHAARNLGRWWGPSMTRADVSIQTTRAYAATRPPVAARRELEVLRAAFGYYSRHYTPIAMPQIYMPPKPEPRERWLTKQEARQLRKAAMGVPHLYRFIVIALATGSRPGAVLALKWDWIDLRGGLMRRRAPGTAESKKRTPPVRIGSRLIRLLRRWKRLDGPLIDYVCHYNGQRVTKLRRSFSRAVKLAGLGGDVVPHTLRHTKATWMMQDGISPWEAAGHLGMSIQMLDRTYGHHHADHQRRAAEV